VARVEEELETKGVYKEVPRNIFDIKEVPKPMAELWMKVGSLIGG